MIGVLSGPEMKAQLGLIVTRRSVAESPSVIGTVLKRCAVEFRHPESNRWWTVFFLLTSFGSMELLPQDGHFGKICLEF